MPEKKPVTLEFKNIVFNGTFVDEYANGSFKSSGDLVITAEAETIDSVTQFLNYIAAEEEREVAA
jgi:hypothetical protein